MLSVYFIVTDVIWIAQNHAPFQMGINSNFFEIIVILLLIFHLYTPSCYLYTDYN